MAAASFFGWLLVSCSLTVDLPRVGNGATGGSGGVSGEDDCRSPTDCPGDEGECVTRTCEGGVCGQRFRPDGERLDSQMYGDCRTRTCDGSGMVKEVADGTDFLRDQSTCTTEMCSGMTSVVNDVAAGQVCEDGRLCNGQGECVKCLEDAHCVTTPGCAGNLCACDLVFFICELRTCQNGVMDATETDVDCGGGSCSPCGIGDDCSLGSDCASGSCSIAEICLLANCTDGVANGGESDVDCGGPCAPCNTGQSCALALDCQSSVCSINGSCSAPDCADGVNNGTETDVDCGGPCTGCGKGKSCESGEDCLPGLICPSGVCKFLEDITTGSAPMKP